MPCCSPSGGGGVPSVQCILGWWPGRWGSWGCSSTARPVGMSVGDFRLCAVVMAAESGWADWDVAVCAEHQACLVLVYLFSDLCKAQNSSLTVRLLVAPSLTAGAHYLCLGVR